MKRFFFQELPQVEQDLVDSYLDGTIAPSDFERLQERMLESAALRGAMRRALALDSSLRSEVETNAATAWLKVADESAGPAPSAKARILHISPLIPISLAAALVLFFGLGSLYWNTIRVPKPIAGPSSSPLEEPSAAGFAVVGRLFGVQWQDEETDFREGDALGSEAFRLAVGTAEIHFYSGASMTVEGPAEISLKSAWEAYCHQGALRMQVPPAARGFKIQAPATEIVDMGTEFGLVVRNGEGHVEVFEGEISIQHRDEPKILARQGSAYTLPQDRPAVLADRGGVAYPDSRQFDTQAVEQRKSSFARWQAHRDELASNPEVLAYYTFSCDQSQSRTPNLALPRNSDFDGTVVLAEPVDGRWPGLKSALEFHRPSSRVRVNIPGEFPALTFFAWIRIDSLDRRYNAIFMGDGYETGEPHWQIQDDGRLMLSVMVDESKAHPHYPNIRFHHVYRSTPLWDMSLSGQWLQIASVYDPDNRTVSHYRNGRRLSRESIADGFLVETLRIGNAEIGNWGQPFREDPSFSIRNLNGRMDEFAIFQSALSDDEIAELYKRSRADSR